MHRAVSRLLTIPEGELASVVEQLEALARGLAVIEDRFRIQSILPLSTTGARQATAVAMAEFRQHLLARLNLQRRRIATALEREVDRQIVEGGEGLRRFLHPDADVKLLLEGPLERFAHRTVTAALSEAVEQMLASGSDHALCDQEIDLVSLIASGCGGPNGGESAPASALRLIIPQTAASADFLSRVRLALPGVEVIPCEKADLTVCRCFPEKPLSEHADQIIAGIDLYKELAERLLTRVDVSWTTFPAAPASPSKEAARAPALSAR